MIKNILNTALLSGVVLLSACSAEPKPAFDVNTKNLDANYGMMEKTFIPTENRTIWSSDKLSKGDRIYTYSDHSYYAIASVSDTDTTVTAKNTVWKGIAGRKLTAEDNVTGLPPTTDVTDYTIIQVNLGLTVINGATAPKSRAINYGYTVYLENTDTLYSMTDTVALADVEDIDSVATISLTGITLENTYYKVK